MDQRAVSGLFQHGARHWLESTRNPAAAALNQGRVLQEEEEEESHSQSQASSHTAGNKTTVCRKVKSDEKLRRNNKQTNTKFPRVSVSFPVRSTHGGDALLSHCLEWFFRGHL